MGSPPWHGQTRRDGRRVDRAARLERAEDRRRTRGCAQCAARYRRRRDAARRRGTASGRLNASVYERRSGTSLCMARRSHGRHCRAGSRCAGHRRTASGQSPNCNNGPTSGCLPRQRIGCSRPGFRRSPAHWSMHTMQLRGRVAASRKVGPQSQDARCKFWVCCTRTTMVAVDPPFRRSSSSKEQESSSPWKTPCRWRLRRITARCLLFEIPYIVGATVNVAQKR